jgi:hypothetical protein
LSERINRNLESIINKLISANKKMSSIYIWITIIFLIIGVYSSIFALEDLIKNLESYINIHNKFKK